MYVHSRLLCLINSCNKGQIIYFFDRINLQYYQILFRLPSRNLYKTRKCQKLEKVPKKIKKLQKEREYLIGFTSYAQ